MNLELLTRVLAVSGFGLGAISMYRTRRPREVTAQRGLRTWFRVSCAFAAVVGLGWVGLIIAALHYDWVTDRVGGALAPLGVVLAAALGSAGAARTLISQSQIAASNRIQDDERLLWERFSDAATQFASGQHFAVRAAGVYSLAGVADDWLRHHRRLKELGVIDRVVKSEAEMIVDILSAHLRQNTHRADALTQDQETAERIVNEAIIAQFGLRTALPDGSASGAGTQGVWAGCGFEFDLRGADLSEALWTRIDLRGAILTTANLYDAELTEADLTGANLVRSDLRKAVLKGAILTDANLTNAFYDGETIWPEGFAIPADVWEVPSGLDQNRPAAEHGKRRLLASRLQCARHAVGRWHLRN